MDLWDIKDRTELVNLIYYIDCAVDSCTFWVALSGLWGLQERGITASTPNPHPVGSPCKGVTNNQHLTMAIFIGSTEQGDASSTNQEPMNEQQLLWEVRKPVKSRLKEKMMYMERNELKKTI